MYGAEGSCEDDLAPCISYYCCCRHPSAHVYFKQVGSLHRPQRNLSTSGRKCTPFVDD